MTTSEKIRLILAIILFLVFLFKRFDLLGKLREKKRKQERLEARRRRREEKKERRQREEERREEKRKETAEILKRGVSHLRQKTARAAGEEIWYLEGGARPDAQLVLLLHGFGGDKETWGEVGKLLMADGYHLVAPDLPGFGQNEKNEDKPYDVTTQAKRIRAFCHKVAAGQRFHLVGHSVGGTIGAALAYAAPREVASLTLIEPFGVHVPYESELDQLLAQERNPMVIANPAAYDNLLGFVFHQPPNMPAAIKKVRADRTAENRAFYLKVWAEVREGERANLLDLLLPVLEMKTLVIQGAESRVVHPSTPDVVRSMMHDSRTALIEGCGHFPMLERPRQTARHIIDFLASMPSS